ncbi:MAG: STAS domain-containing protein [Lachnospiraceae bacterium]|nr:STAS domain-containing protein [Lachnospiraceae bacterium]
MEIIRMKTDDTETLSIIGRIDTITSPQLQTVLVEAISLCEKVELDFAEVSYVSSAGLRVLLMGQKSANTAEKKMIVKNISSQVMEVLNITGFSGILNIV